MMVDPFDLERFIEAQRPRYDAALAELRSGTKHGHWMWFVFPQMRGLGRSATARYFGIGSMEEARAYLAHPLLGNRLREATETVLATEDLSLHQIFGSPDDLKFHSSMTLFALASGLEDTPFHAALERWHGGQMDLATVKLLEGET